MRINSLWYRDNAQKWEVSEIDFFDLTLLVGASGVGKTQILNAILNLAEIADGKEINNVEWKISFSNEGKNYRWEGQYQNVFRQGKDLKIEKDTDGNDLRVFNEKIFVDGKLITARNQDKVEFDNVRMPKLAPEESILHIFRAVEEIQFAYEGFKRINFRDHTINDKFASYSLVDYEQYKRIIEHYSHLEQIRESELSTIEKLACIYLNQYDLFNIEIKEQYKNIFPQIEDVRLKPVNETSGILQWPLFQFKEKEVNKWIPATQMSSGMLRTFLHICELFLLSEGTVVLIDEFENSLGVNCIDVLTEDLIYENNRLQFIATSHHPYIINKIPYEYWKIVTRKGGVIKTHNAQEFDLGASSHERFMNLINLPQYKSGIESLA